MQPHYLGVDIAGAQSTWMCALTPSGGKLTITQQPIQASLKQIIQYAEEYPVVATAIDAQLTWAISDERGFRPSDLELRDILPKQCVKWVASQNSLMAVPVRGRQLAEYLSPVVGTIIETHPRVCLYFADNSLLASVMLYKSNDGATHTEKLWRFWIKRFHIDAKTPMTITHDALDSMVCATVAYLYHHLPEQLKRLSYVAEDKRGRGPFVVIEPN